MCLGVEQQAICSSACLVLWLSRRRELRRVRSLRVRMLSRTFSLAHMSSYDVVPQMRFSKRDITILASRMPWRETTARGQVRTARRRYVASPEEAMAMGAWYLARCLLWNFRCCLLGSPTSTSLATRSAPVPSSPLAPYPREARLRSERRARHENGARSERGTGTEREWEAPAGGAWRRQRGAMQEGASTGRRTTRGCEHRRARAQKGPSTGGPEHRRARAQEAHAERRAHGWVAQGTRKQSAKFAGKTAKVPEFLFA
jgi:hypothetical protein